MVTHASQTIDNVNIFDNIHDMFLLVIEDNFTLARVFFDLPARELKEVAQKQKLVRARFRTSWAAQWAGWRGERYFSVLNQTAVVAGEALMAPIRAMVSRFIGCIGLTHGTDADTRDTWGCRDRRPSFGYLVACAARLAPERGVSRPRPPRALS
jgi:hypothetical protein